MSDKDKATKTEPKPIPPSLPEELLPLYDWYMGKGKDQILGAVIALVAVLAVIATMRYRDGQNAEASFALSSANGVESLEGLNAKYSGTKVGQVISLRLAKAYYDQGEYEQAASLYAACEKKNRKGPLAAQASLGHASSLEALAAAESTSDHDSAMEKFNQAKALFSKLASDKDSPVYAEAAMGEARCLAALGDKAAATDVLDRLAIDVKDTRHESMVESLRDVIDRFNGFRNTSIFDRLDTVDPGESDVDEAEEIVPSNNAPAEATAADVAAETAPAAPETPVAEEEPKAEEAK